MKNLLNIALSLSIAALLYSGPAAADNQPANGGISMTIYPVVRGTDGNQYLITPSGKHVTVPGLGIAQNATQIPVYRDMANHFWYTNLNGQQVAVSQGQLEAAQAQINAQSGGGGTQSYYSSTPTYAGGYNGIPYGTPVNMEGQGQYSYVGSGGNKQFITPSPQANAQFNQWQQQTPYGQPQNIGNMQNAQSQQMQKGSTLRHSGTTLGENRRDRRANRLENRSKDQASNAANDKDYANSKMDSGETLGTGFRSRRSARETRRSNREDRRVNRLDGN